MRRGVSGGARMALGYRQVMQVCELARYGAGGTFPICPRCGSAMEREYQRYCDRCGQCLGWRELNRARVIERGLQQQEGGD